MRKAVVQAWLDTEPKVKEWANGSRQESKGNRCTLGRIAFFGFLNVIVKLSEGS